MRRALSLSVLLLAVLALPAAAETAPPASLQLPQMVACSASAAPLSPLAPAPEPKVEDLLEAAGLVPGGAVAVATLPDCPAVHGCPSGPYNKCKGTNCGTVDTGYTACQTGTSKFSCTGGQTIHVTTCQCTTAFEARCCTTFPACICVRCDAFTSSSLSCQ